jgi:hypothetical protein
VDFSSKSRAPQTCRGNCNTLKAARLGRSLSDENAIGTAVALQMNAFEPGKHPGDFDRQKFPRFWRQLCEARASSHSISRLDPIKKAPIGHLLPPAGGSLLF